MTPSDQSDPVIGLKWRTLRPLKSFGLRWRKLLDSRLESLRANSPGLVEDSWWIAEVPVSSLDSLPVGSARRLRNPRGSFLADPIPLAGTHDEFLLEQYFFKTKRGVVSHLRFDADGRAQLLEGVIDEAFHLSFPMSFVWDDRTWVVCEAAASGVTHIWEYNSNHRAVRRPDPLFDYPLRDVSVFRDGDLWYLLGTVADPDWELVMYSSESPVAGWKEMPLQNHTDVVRLAGSPILQSTDLVTDAERATEWAVPLQGSSRGYGSEIVVCSLRIADGQATLETRSQVDPPAPYIGMHTIALGESKALVDIKHLKIRRDRLGYWLGPRRLGRRLKGVFAKSTAK